MQQFVLDRRRGAVEAGVPNADASSEVRRDTEDASLSLGSADRVKDTKEADRLLQAILLCDLAAHLLIPLVPAGVQSHSAIAPSPPDLKRPNLPCGQGDRLGTVGEASTVRPRRPWRETVSRRCVRAAAFSHS